MATYGSSVEMTPVKGALNVDGISTATTATAVNSNSVPSKEEPIGTWLCAEGSSLLQFRVLVG